MKRMDILTKVAILLTTVLVICTIANFLSLHDIEKDYVSHEVLRSLEVDTSKELPGWTNTELEWSSLRVSYAIRFLSIVISLFILVLLRSDIHRASRRELSNQ